MIPLEDSFIVVGSTTTGQSENVNKTKSQANSDDNHRFTEAPVTLQHLYPNENGIYMTAYEEYYKQMLKLKLGNERKMSGESKQDFLVSFYKGTDLFYSKSSEK